MTVEAALYLIFLALLGLTVVLGYVVHHLQIIARAVAYHAKTVVLVAHAQSLDPAPRSEQLAWMADNLPGFTKEDRRG